jgi:two-component system LytT family response regulator
MSNAPAYQRNPEAIEPAAARTFPLQVVLPDNEPPTPTRGKSGKGKNSVVVLPTMEGFCFEKVKHINFLEASGNYTMLHFTDGRQVLVCKTLRELESMLPEDAFVRIHRSHTIHLKHIKKYVRGKGGHVVLHNNATLVVSSGQRDLFLEALKNYF